MQQRLLAIEDDTRLARMLGEYLGGYGFSLDCRETAAEGLATLAEAD